MVLDVDEALGEMFESWNSGGGVFRAYSRDARKGAQGWICVSAVTFCIVLSLLTWQVTAVTYLWRCMYTSHQLCSLQQSTFESATSSFRPKRYQYVPWNILGNPQARVSLLLHPAPIPGWEQ